MDGHRMRKINGKLFLVLLLAGTATVGTAFAVHHFQYRRIATALLWQARQAEEQGQTARSAEYLQRYLEFQPRDLDEKARLAKLWTGDGASPRARLNAVNLMDEVVLYQDDPELRRLLVKTALEVGDYRRAREHLAKLLPWDGLLADIAQVRENVQKGKPLGVALEREDRSRGELELFWGQLQEQDKKPADAIGCYRLSVLHAPNAPTGAIRLAYLLRRAPESDSNQRKKNFADADKVLGDMVERNADNCDAYLARWRYRREFDLMAIRETGPRGTDIPLEIASRDVAEAMKRRPDSLDVILAAADLEKLRVRSFAEAFERPVDERRKGMAEHRVKALEHLQRGLDLVRKNKGTSETMEFQFLWHKGNLLLDDLDYMRIARRDQSSLESDAEKLTEIAAVIEQVRKTHMPAAADYMKGRLHINKLEWGLAAQLFERSLTQMSSQRDLSCQANLYLGQCYERLEEHAQMFNAFKRVTDEDPTAVPAILGKAAARWAQGQLGEALAHYMQAMQQKAVPPRACLDIARLEMQIQGPNPKPDWTGAENALKGAAKMLEPEHLELVLLRAELALRKEDVKGAREILTAAREKVPGEAEFLTALVDIALRQKNKPRAEELLEEGKKSLPDSVALRLSFGRVFAAINDKDTAAKILALGEGRGKFTEEDQGRLLSGLADTLFRADAHPQARAMWQALTALPKQKGDLRLRMLLFDLAMKDSDQAGMQQTLEDISKIEPANGAYNRYGEALLLIWQARNDSTGATSDRLNKARRNLDAVLALRPNWSAVFLARAEIAELAGAPEQAIKDLQEARKNGDTSPSVVRKLATLLTKAGREGEAQMMLATLEKSLLYNTELGRLAVTVALRRGEMGQAVELMRRAVREDTRDPKQLVWMAQVMIAAGKFGEAENHLRNAVERKSDSAECWVALVQFLISQKREKEALKELKRMKEKLPKEQLSLALARCQDDFGKPKEAVQAYADALEAGKDDALVVKAVAVGHLNANRSPLAEPLLRRLAKNEILGTIPGDIDWAKRNLALLLAGGTSSQRFAEALELVGLSLDDKGNLPKDLPATTNTELRRTQARVLAAQSQKQFRDHAIKLLDELSRARATSSDDEFVLAMLFDAAGQPAKSRERLKKLCQPQTRSPRYLAQYAMTLLAQGKPEELTETETVIGWIEEIEKQTKSAPNRFASVELRARVLEARGKGDDAIALLVHHTERDGAKPEEMVLVVGSYSRQKRYNDAFRLCQKAWTEGAVVPEALGAMSVSLLRVMNPTDAQVESMQAKIVEAIAAKPKAVVLHLHLADLYDRRGKYDLSAGEYREVLKQEPNNVVALNNLAWLLALSNKDNVEAMECINKAIGGMGRRPELLDTRGMVHLAGKDNAKALADFEEATAAAPTPARLYYQARILHEDRKTTRAREILGQAREKGLKADALHPIEQEACRKLLEEYGFR
jgi:tetratricopeptide (TPR) repeat protein